jgi:hypothetical protein
VEFRLSSERALLLHLQHKLPRAVVMQNISRKHQAKQVTADETLHMSLSSV